MGLGGAFSLVAQHAGEGAVLGLLAIISGLALPVALGLEEAQAQD